ncbi:MAG: MBL fold metallo-hydrolase [Halalkalicoccus sp.]
MSKTEFGPAKISPDEVAARRDDEELFILDVRNEDDYEEWAIENSHNVPIYDELLDEEFDGLEASIDEFPKDKEIATVCVGGITSARAAEFLRDRGYNARSVTDGMRGWGRVHQAYDIEGAEGVTQIVRPGTGCISYLVYDRDEAFVVDPSLYTDTYLDVADERDVEIIGAIDTHAHADHISGGPVLADELDVPYYLHDADSGDLEGYTPMDDGETLTVGESELDVIHTPGHTPGSVSLLFGEALLAGDTLFIRSVGRPDLEGNDEEDIRDGANELYDSLERLAELRDDTVVLPGHFSDEEIRPLATTLYQLRTDNELFGMDDKEAFIETIVEGLSDEPANYNEIKNINWGREELDDDAADLELGPNNCAAN